jgi:hypothetical protein
VCADHGCSLGVDRWGYRHQAACSVPHHRPSAACGDRVYPRYRPFVATVAIPPAPPWGAAGSRPWRRRPGSRGRCPASWRHGEKTHLRWHRPHRPPPMGLAHLAVHRA